MKKLLFLFFLLISAVAAIAGTVSGTHQEDGTDISGYHVAAYSFGTVGNYAIGNATLVGTDTTDANGEWSISTTQTTQHLVIIKDTADDAKKAIAVFVTPAE